MTELTERTKTELQQVATLLEIEGRSGIDKAELAAAIAETRQYQRLQRCYDTIDALQERVNVMERDPQDYADRRIERLETVVARWGDKRTPMRAQTEAHLNSYRKAAEAKVLDERLKFEARLASEEAEKARLEVEIGLSNDMEVSR